MKLKIIIKYIYMFVNLINNIYYFFFNCKRKDLGDKCPECKKLMIDTGHCECWYDKWRG